ncbi:FAR1-related sequence 5-like protein [Tanacetum coccineum]
MLLREDTEAYTWLLTSFMTAHEKQPTMVVTDQDGAMKRAIEAVLTESTHRLCMWHIMQKVPAKICPEIYDETDFKERFGKLVWNMFMEPLEFEGKWSKLVEDFGLQNHKWMTKITEAAAGQERRIAASATEQEERNSDTAHIVDKEQSNTTS